MSENMSIERQQCRMLVEAIKKIVTNPRTPSWIKNPLETAVKEAKALQPSEHPAGEEKVPERASMAHAGPMAQAEPIPNEVGAECVDALDPKDECLYKIVRKGLVIDGVQLWDALVLKGDKKTPVGVTILNVPNHYLRAVRPPETESR